MIYGKSSLSLGYDSLRLRLMNLTKLKTAGFTLVESLVAITVFSMVIAGGLIGVQRGFEIIDNSRHYTRVSQVLQSEVESLRTLSWIDMASLPASAEVTLSPKFDKNVYSLYTITREIVAEEADRKRIEVTVDFQNRRGRQVSLRYVTFFTSGGVNDYFYRTI